MTTDRLSMTFAALADPTRRAILARLTAGETSVKELAAPFAMSGPAVSKHLRVLEQAGLISRGRDAQWRPCRLEAGPLAEVAAFAEEYRRVLGGENSRPGAHLQLGADGQEGADKKQVSGGGPGWAPPRGPG